ncbi:MAG: PIN domain-containing protein [Methanomicrobia archaeon]|nr:PIN domain-containing protein [Methanomicrobia archaeon]
MTHKLDSNCYWVNCIYRWCFVPLVNFVLFKRIACFANCKLRIRLLIRHVYTARYLGQKDLIVILKELEENTRKIRASSRNHHYSLPLNFDLSAAEKSSEIMAKLLSSGKAVNALDILIAGIAIANGAEKIATSDGDFMEISKVAELEVQVY